MSRVKVLDCTLRDGGYINEWMFGDNNIDYVLSSLVESDVDIVEIGFLSNQTEANKDSSKFTSFEAMDERIKESYATTMFVCMINYGEFDIKEVPFRDETKIDGIRLAFHKKDVTGALEFAKGVIGKGFKLFLQPMVAANYNDHEYLDLIREANSLNPYAFYIVDSFGQMTKQDVIRYFFMVEYNLDRHIYVGYHSHNNLQLAYSNAQALLGLDSYRELIIDSSIYGMGRGAGNLNTELFMGYLNELKLGNYNISPLLNVIDYVLKPIYEIKYWGYSLPHYLSAINGCHPNYASYLADRGTLTVKAIDDVLSLITSEKKINFDKSYIRNLYYEYQEKLEAQISNVDQLNQLISEKNVLLYFPGLSIVEEEDKIRGFVDSHENLLKIAVNFLPQNHESDLVFFSNLRRYEKANNANNEKIILTSNIPNNKNVKFKVSYRELLNEVEGVQDNAGMMLIKLLIKHNVKGIYLAGLDGYSLDRELNFSDQSMSIAQTSERLKLINEGMNKLIKEFRNQTHLTFITKSKHIY